MSVFLDSQEISYFRESGKRLTKVLDSLEQLLLPGKAPYEIETQARSLIAAEGDVPAFLGYKPHGAPRPYPAALCFAVNDEVVHGIPHEDKPPLAEGDIVTIDLGLSHRGFITDAARSLAVGAHNENTHQFLRAGREALAQGIRAAYAGKHIGDISHAIEQSVASTPYVIIRELGGHGVGRSVHEDPFIPNVGRPGSGERLVPGMALAIEVMLAEKGNGRIIVDKDGYTIRTQGGERSIQCEHTILIKETGEPEIIAR